MKSRSVSHYLVVSLFLFLISIMFPVDAMKSITYIYMALAEKVDSVELEKVLVEDVIILRNLIQNSIFQKAIGLEIQIR